MRCQQEVSEGCLLPSRDIRGDVSTNLLYCYDADGNVVQLVDASDGSLKAHYEYGPYGGIIRQSGIESTNNLLRFSTKYLDDETDLYYYGLRYYSPGLGRWPSRDPIGERGEGSYRYVLNDPLNRFDYLGLWGELVHRQWTRLWAIQEGYSSQSATEVGERDNGVDGFFSGTSPYPFPAIGDQSYHFNTSASGDSRINHANAELQAAKDACDWSLGHDEHLLAAHKMGLALHPRQDWVAHGDFPGGAAWHNFNGPFIPGLTGMLDGGHPASSPYNMQYYPDTIWLDAKGSDADADGRPVGTNVRNTNKASFEIGSKRFNKTRDLSKTDLQAFLNHVKAKAKTCGRCRQFFLTEDAVP